MPPALTTVHNAENAACFLNKGIAQAQKPPLKLLHAQLASPKRLWDTRGAGVAVGRVTSSMSVIINAGTYAHHVQQQAGCNSRWLSHQSHLFLSFFFCTFGLIYFLGNRGTLFQQRSNFCSTFHCTICARCPFFFLSGLIKIHLSFLSLQKCRLRFLFTPDTRSMG